MTPCSVLATGGGSGGSPPSPPTGPTANFTYSISGLTVNVTSTSTQGSTPFTCDWNWGDGSPHAGGTIASHLYISGGFKTITLTVTDQNGLWSNFSQTVMLVANYKVSGTVSSGGFPLNGVAVNVSGSAFQTVFTGSNGTYGFFLAGGGNYTITPSFAGYTFSPSSQSYFSLNANQIQNFIGTPVSPPPLTVQIITPANGSSFVLGADSQQTGNIAAQARVLDGATDVTALATVNWTVVVQWNSVRSNLYTTTVAQPGATPTFNFDVGKDAVVTVNASYLGRVGSVQAVWTILGTNPANAAVDTEFGTYAGLAGTYGGYTAIADRFRAIGWLESNQTWDQFKVNGQPNQEPPTPPSSGDTGIMKISEASWGGLPPGGPAGTSPYYFQKVAWQWKTNIGRAENIFRFTWNRQTGVQQAYTPPLRIDVATYGYNRGDMAMRDNLDLNKTEGEVIAYLANDVLDSGTAYVRVVKTHQANKPWQ